MRSQHLCAVVPVGFVAVVLLGVVAGGEDDAALATEVADGEGHFGRGAHIIEEIYLDAVGGEDVGRSLGEEAAVVAAVVAHYHTDLFQILEILVQVVGEALCGGAHRVDVHAVRSGPHDATQTARAEFERTVEGVNKLGFVGIFNHGLHGLLRFGIVAIGGHPLLGHLLALSNELLGIVHSMVCLKNMTLIKK